MLVSPVGEDGGGERVLLSLARHLPKLGCEVFLALMRPGPIEGMARSRGIACEAFQSHRYRDLRKVAIGKRWLQGIAQDFKADVADVNHMALLYTSHVSKSLHIPIVWHQYDRSPLYFDLLSWMLQQYSMQHIIFTTPEVQASYPRLNRVPATLIAPVCIEPEELRSTPLDPKIRERLSLSDGPLFLTVARLQEHKGHRFLIEAARDVLRYHPSAMFAIVGKATEPAHELYVAELKELCGKFGISKAVKFLGYVGQDDLCNLYRIATAIVHPATTEGYGLVLLEAVSLECPVIAAAAEGPARIFRHKVDALLVPTASPEALSVAMISFLDDPKMARSLASRALSRIQELDASAMAKQVRQVYLNVMGEKGSEALESSAET